MLSAFLCPDGLAAGLLESVVRSHLLLVSPEIAAEYGAVFTRPDFEKVGTGKERLRWLQDVFATPRCRAVKPRLRFATFIRQDPSDDRFVEVAVSGQADYLVSRDPHLLDMKQIRNPLLTHPISIVAPEAREMLELLPKRRPGQAANEK